MSTNPIVPRFSLSARGDFHNKDMRGGNPATNWRAVNWSMSELAHHAASGNAMAVSVFRFNYRTVDNVLATHVLGLDFEHGGVTAEDLAADTFLKPFAGVIMPTASDRPDEPRARVFIPLNRGVTNVEYGQLYNVFKAKYAGKVDVATSDTARFFFGAEQPDNSRVFVNDYALLDVDAFLLEHAEIAAQITQHSGNSGRKLSATTASATLKTLAAAVKPGFKPVAFTVGTDKEREVLDLLQFVARLWDTGVKPAYEVWLNTCLAAHHATDGSALVRDYIASEPRFWKWDDNTGFSEWWDNAIHHETNTPVTIGTLKHYAKLAGWGTYSQFELSRVDRVVNGRYLLDVLKPDELPQGENILIKQQTGGGKTHFCITSAKAYKPSRVLFIAPYITLNIDLANKARNDYGVPTDHYLSKERDRKHALAATLQYVTSHGYDTASYDLIVIEEVHQIIEQLSLPSHMSIDQRAAAFQWLRDALRSRSTVVMVDAGINQTTVDFVESLSGAAAYVVVNAHIQPKPPIEIISENDGLGMIATGGDKLVVATFGRQTARMLFNLAARPGILITGETSRQRNVRGFMKDVEQGAANYDLVIYNKAMGSGTSIQSVVPDRLLQWVDMHGAGDHVQILNRYRTQPDKVYAVYDVRPQRRIDETTARQVVDARHSAEQDALVRLLGLQTGDKGELARLADSLYVRLLIERNEQLIAPFDYYCRVMRQDGRQVIGQPEHVYSETMRQMRAANKEAIVREYEHWREGEDKVPSRNNDKEIPDMTQQDAIQAGLYQTVQDVWGRVPKLGRWSETAAILSAKRYQRGIGHIERALDPQRNFAASMKAVYSENTAKSQTFLFAAVYLLLDACAYLMPDLRGRLTYEELTAKADNFNAMIAHLEPQYNAFVERSRDQLKNLAADKSGVDLAMAILGKVFGKLGINLKGLNRQTKVGGKRQYVRDDQGRIMKDYVVEDVDILVDILAHRKAASNSTDEVIADVVNTVWVRAESRHNDLPLDELAENGLLSVWADAVQQRGRGGMRKARQIADEVLMQDSLMQGDIPF